MEKMKPISHNFMPDQIDSLVAEGTELLTKLNIPNSTEGIKEIIREHSDNKGWMYTLFRKHYYWLEDKHMIIFPFDYELKRTPKDITTFCEWMYDRLYEMHRELYSDIDNFIYETKREEEYISDYYACVANDFAAKLGFKLRAQEGQKLTRIIMRIAKETGIDQIKDKRLNDKGKEREYGWNHQYGLFTRAITPQKKHVWLCISLNYIDFWTMSFGHNWSNCQTIDKNRKGGFSGVHCSGTESLMLDPSTCLVYTIDPSYEGKDYELQDKEKCCIFHLGESGMIIKERVYPDCREGDYSLDKALLNAVQEVVAECMGCDNNWATEKLTPETQWDYIKTEGTHYCDYHNFDTTISFLKKEDGSYDKDRITVGHNPICPNCGCEHEEDETLTCEDCEGICRCAWCHGKINDNDIANGWYFVDPETGNVYCDSRCAEAAGVEIHNEDEEDEWDKDYGELKENERNETEEDQAAYG